MIIDNEDIQEVQQYIRNANIVKLINDQKIHAVLRQAYQEVRTNDQYLFLYYALLKSGMFEEFDASNYGFKVEKFGGAQIKVTVDFDRLNELFDSYENYGSFGRDNIDFKTCLSLIEDTFDVVRNWNYDDPSAYSDIQDDIAKGYIKVNADNEHRLSLYSEEDQADYLAQAAGQAAMDCAISDIYDKACEALTKALKPISDSTNIHDNSVEIIISFKTLLEQLDSSEDWKDELDYVQIDGSLLPCIIGYCLSQNYEFYEPYAGFDTSFTDQQFNDALTSVLELVE